MDAKLTRTIIRIGNSLGITIPQDECVGRKTGDRVVVTLEWLDSTEASMTEHEEKEATP